MDSINMQQNEKYIDSNEQKYQFCIKILKSPFDADISTLKNVRNVLQVLGDYRDSERLLEKCSLLLERKKREQSTEKKTTFAENNYVEKKNHTEPIKWITASAIAFSLIIGAIIIVFFVVKPSLEYKKAIALYEEQHFDEAIDILNTMTSYKDAREKVYQIKTAKAKHLFKNRETEQAINLAYEIGDQELVFQLESSVLNSARIGDTVYFGNFYFYQDAVIPWTVIAKNGKHLLLFADREVAKKKYDDNDFTYEWELCSLRHFLNGDFYDFAFSSDEKKLIQLSTINNAHYFYWQYYDDNGTVDSSYAQSSTQDYVFLLSFGEVWYDYKIKKIELDSSGTWYTRSAGWVIQDERDSDVYNIRRHGIGENLVRPAIWVEID